MTIQSDRYVLAARLGCSGGAVVHAATDRRLQRPVAITVVPSASSGCAGATVARAHTAATLSHPNLVTVLDAGKDPDGGFVVTERIEGATLADRLADGPMDHGETVAMLDAVLAALERLHGDGLAVGGIAPWQVRWGVDGIWALAVLPAGQEDATPLPLGGPVPDVAEPEAPPGRSPAALQAADIASVGVLTVASLTGHVHRGPVDLTTASPSAIEDAEVRALASDALASQHQESSVLTPTSLRRRLPGGAPEGLPATLGLPAPGASTLGRHARRPGIQRLRRLSRALREGGGKEGGR